MFKSDGYIKFFILAGFITALLFTVNSIWFRTYGGDTEWYIAAAEGRLEELIQPYSARFLHPFLVGSLSVLFSLNTEQSFLVIGVISVFIFFVLSATILKKAINLKAIFLFPLFFSPYFLLTIREIFEPDAFYIFLTSLFFFFLFYEKEIAVLLTFFLLFLSRESTSLLGVILAIAAWFKGKKLFAVGVIMIVLISMYLSGVLNSIGRPNIHNLNNSVYLLAKVSFNFLTNVLGVRPWANTYANCEPVFKLSLPRAEQLGDINEVGFCGFEIIRPIQTLIILLTLFGIAPLFLFYAISKNWKTVFQKIPFWLLIALVYGLTNYFIGIVAGTGIQRIVGYGWPAFLLVVPVLISRFFEFDKRSILKLSLIQIFTAWLPLIVYRLNGDNLSSALFILIVVLGIYFYSFKEIKTHLVKNQF